jgi:hypothetical protein
MITNTKQNWEIGNIVKIGFMQLKVLKAIPTPGDWLPDQYLMINVKGDTYYIFVPHNGLQRLTYGEHHEYLNK